MDIGEDERWDPNPDIHALFCYYNSLYFSDALGSCILRWSSKRMTLCAGVCHYLPGGGCEIRLSEPLLKFRPISDLKSTLLHEMIHAYLWITKNNHDHSDHGPNFQALMKEINESTVIDHQRPNGGYNITVYHSFSDEVDNYRVHHWHCESCGDLIKRAMNRKPSPSDCIDHRGQEQICGNSYCHWHSHQIACGGTYKKIAEPAGYKDKKRDAKGKNKIQEQISDATKGKRGGKKILGSINEPEIKCSRIDDFYSVTNDAVDQTSDNTYQFSVDNLYNVEGQHSDCGKNLGSKRKRKYTRVESNNKAQFQRNYTVIVKWKDWYANEEVDDDVEPLLNKRTEGRKKQKLLNFSSEMVLLVDPLAKSSSSKLESDNFNDKMKNCLTVNPPLLIVEDD